MYNFTCCIGIDIIERRDNMNILLVNGYQKNKFSKGKLNCYLYNIFLNNLRSKHDIRVSSVEDYSVMEERNKFLWADLIIYQFPIHWFSCPAKLKKYIDEIFSDDEFFSLNNKYGLGGLMKGKSYIFSTTWGAPEEVFGNNNEFFDGKCVDDVLLPLHKTMEFCGFTKRKSISFHDVVKNCNPEEFKEKLIKYIKEEI